jgi:asparagine synthase (glutamine-hydrolysing)
MCDIAGIYASDHAPNPIDGHELMRIRDHMAARGPDEASEWISDIARIVFGRRRPSVTTSERLARRPC